VIVTDVGATDLVIIMTLVRVILLVILVFIAIFTLNVILILVLVICRRLHVDAMTQEIGYAQNVIIYVMKNLIVNAIISAT